MNEGRSTSRRVVAAGVAAAVVLGVTGAVWLKARTAASPPPPVVEAGPPIQKGGATYVPVRTATSPPGQVDGYGLAVSTATADALKGGKTVVVPGPNGGTIEMRAVEKAPPPPGAKK
jgi:hypothetical protein